MLSIFSEHHLPNYFDLHGRDGTLLSRVEEHETGSMSYPTGASIVCIKWLHAGSILRFRGAGLSGYKGFRVWGSRVYRILWFSVSRTWES